MKSLTVTKNLPLIEIKNYLTKNDLSSGKIMVESQNQISYLNKEWPEKLEKVLFYLLHDLNNWIGAKHPLTKEHFEQLIPMINETYWMLKIEDIAHCFKLIKTNRKVKVHTEKGEKFESLMEVYDRLTPHMIMGAIDKWQGSVTRMDAIHTYNKRKYPEPDYGTLAESLKDKLNKNGEE